jgi:hypothetical protein
MRWGTAVEDERRATFGGAKGLPKTMCRTRSARGARRDANGGRPRAYRPSSAGRRGGRHTLSANGAGPYRQRENGNLKGGRHDTAARLRQGRDGRGHGGRARLCANTAIASPKARGRPASRRTSSTVDVLALRHPSNGTVVTVAPWRRKTPRQSGWQKR